MKSPQRNPSKKRKRARNAAPRGRPKKGTEDWAPAFLGALYVGNHVRDAVAIAGVESSTAYRRREHDGAFRKAWQIAYEAGTKELEAESARRAYHGTLRPVFYRGAHVGDIRKYSDTLLMFLLRARNPKKYRERLSLEATGRHGGPIQFTGISVKAQPPMIVKMDQ